MTHELDASSPVLGWAHEAVGPALDRRRLLGWATGVGAAAAAARLGLGAARPAFARRQEPALPATGHTWLLASPDALRPTAPDAPTAAELDELLDFQGKRTEATVELVDRWGARPAVLPWLDQEWELLYDFSGIHGSRAAALVRAAMNDAVIAALDAQAAHARPAPATADDRINVVGDASAEPSFPSVHAAVAGAASTVFAYLVPDASADGFAGLAEEAATSRLWAGARPGCGRTGRGPRQGGRLRRRVGRDRPAGRGRLL